MSIRYLIALAITLLLCSCHNDSKPATGDKSDTDTASVAAKLDYLRPAAPRFASASDIIKYVTESSFATADGDRFKAAATPTVLDFNANEANVEIAGERFFVAVDDLSGGIMRLSDMKLYEEQR